MKNLSRLQVLSSLSILGLATAFAVGCSDSAEPADTSTTPDASPDGAETCETGKTGTLQLVVTGLPEGVAAKVKLEDASGSAIDATGSSTFADRASGTYGASAERVVLADPIVRTVFEPTISTSSFCVAGSETITVTVSYAAIPTSNKLWTTNANSESGHALAFAGALLASSGTPSASVAIKGSVGSGLGGAVAFDKDGNLWSFGGTTVDAGLLRFPARTLGSSGDKTADIAINADIGGCGPAYTGLAFDPSGALWITVLCADKVLRIGPEKLAASGDYVPDAADYATGVKGPRHVAFDKSGNMWVSEETSLVLYPAASLAAGQPHVSTFKLALKTDGDAPLPPDALAFDKSGNLWVTNFGGNVVSKLTPSDLTPAGVEKTVVPSVSITVSVGALLESLAFDESGGLWTTFSQGKLARLAPEQLGASSSPGDPTIPSTIVTSSDIGYAGGIAFFPAAANLPLYSRAP